MAVNEVGKKPSVVRKILLGIGGVIALCCGLTVVAAVVAPPSAKATPTPGVAAIAAATAAPSATPTKAPSATAMPEPTKVAETANNALNPVSMTDEEKTYLVKVTVLLEQMRIASSEITNASLDAAKNTAILDTVDWKARVVAATAMLKSAGDQFGDIRPVPQRMKILDGIFKGISDETTFFYGNFLDGVDKKDARLLGVAQKNLDNIGAYINDAKAEMKRLGIESTYTQLSEPTKVVSATKPLATALPATPTAGAKSPQVKLYLAAVGEKADAMSKAIKLFGGLMSEASDKPTLLVDSEWKVKAAAAMALMLNAANDLGEIEPTPKEGAALDGVLKKIKAETRVMVDNYAKGIDKLDSKSIVAGNENMKAINGYVVKALEEIDKLAK